LGRSEQWRREIPSPIEAKGNVSRDAITMAIGQIFDYKRFASTKTAVSILLPERPRRDLVELIESAGINMIYQAEDAFTRRCPPTRVLSNGFSTVETKAGLRGMIAGRAGKLLIFIQSVYCF
jgi:hypothetical protein